MNLKKFIQIGDTILAIGMAVGIEHEKVERLDRQRNQCIRRCIPPMADLLLVDRRVGQPIPGNGGKLVRAARKHAHVRLGIDQCHVEILHCALPP